MRQSVPIRSRISRRALGPRDDADSILFEHEFLHAKDEPTFQSAARRMTRPPCASLPEGLLIRPKHFLSGPCPKSIGEKTQGDCPLFEPWIIEFVDVAMYPNEKSVAATRN